MLPGRAMLCWNEAKKDLAESDKPSHFSEVENLISIGRAAHMVPKISAWTAA